MRGTRTGSRCGQGSNVTPPQVIAAAVAEVRDFGELNSTARTARQTDTANFWFDSSPALWTKPIRVALAATSRRPLLKQAELVALANATLVDTQIATSDSKYT
ncbi:hypothetical protein ACNPQM_19625 [Streptomyces sp. NPDC056231]|uniref:hypothetical protein n=1 Tax=Streptomyces sp. NPDC056231 TaxID=3345755 RepID=UPI003AAEE61E